MSISKSLPEREYEVASNRCVWGKRGEVVKLTLTEGEELSLLEAGTIKLVEPPAEAKANATTKKVN